MLPRARLERAPFELTAERTTLATVDVPREAMRPDAFALAVDGDCMRPLYKSGDYVVCWPCASHSEIEQGHPAAVELLDGRWLLKQVFHEPEQPGRLVLRCRNRKRFPRDVVIAVDDVRSIARAVYRVPAR